MIKRIVSGGQTGVDRAALDVAIKLGIAHGGWIPRGRLTENGPLPKKYHLKETSSSRYAVRTEKNVVDTDGTLILSHGELTGGTEYTRKMAIRHGRPWLHIDLVQTAAFHAATAINHWIQEKRIEILNVAGARTSEDPAIYSDTLKILESVYYLGLVEDNMTGDDKTKNPRQLQSKQTQKKPQSVAEAVEDLISKLTLKDKAKVANLAQSELPGLQLSLGAYIMDYFGLPFGNQELVKSCRSVSNENLQHAEDAATVIINALWQKLQQTHKLRTIK
ncbi:MAG: putative molybdenum carrier protein [Desulfobacterales bacterium]|jgi:hypothetical protein